METTGKEKRRRLHSIDRRESPHKTNILQTVVTAGGTFAGTEVLGLTPGKRMIHDYLTVCNSRLHMIHDYLALCNSRWKKRMLETTSSSWSNKGKNCRDPQEYPQSPTECSREDQKSSGKWPPFAPFSAHPRRRCRCPVL